ncbi:MAG: hypothetical protein ACR2FV_04560, partial [Ornithinimicrobium sp.]|uniref:hypothetical protein n=1 Tax=Ornithinimicrobium sp. TaxID=1977084 RepID=UPI003D9B5AA8
EHWLGMPVEGQGRRREGGGRQLPAATALPHPLVGGTLRLARVRLVDTFGRTLDVPTDAVATTLPLETDDAHMLLRPRVQHGARCLFRLVDPAHPIDADPLGAREAFVNQIDHDIQVNPVAGFLLPDHIDEALEVFAGDGTPLGQLAHDPITGSPRWEPAPGRPLPPDAGPYADLPPAAAPLGHLVTGLLQADTRARHGGDAPEASALSELLRAIDTTLWSVDTFAALGTPSIAALVGRPVAVVRATLRLETPDDVDEVVVEETGGAAARRQRFAALADHQFVVRLGSIERSDDSLLAFVVDDDYRHVRVVDKAVAAHARAGGRHEGYLGPLGRHGLPDERPLSHPYLLAEDELLLRPGQTLRLTMLMLPAGLVHLTTGILPRKVLRLADEWVTPGLRRLMPSVRVGPVLVDPAEIRMPKVNALGDRQQFTRRTGPLSWRDDPITAASQAALLPRIPHEAQEGWVRVIPQEEEPS